METAAKLGYEGVELQLHTPSLRNFHHFLDWAQELGIKITAIGTGLESSINHMHFSSPDLEIRKRIRKSFPVHRWRFYLRSISLPGPLPGKLLSAKKGDISIVWQKVQALADMRKERRPACLGTIVFYLTNLLNTTDEARIHF
jgi:hypothetical protein